MNRDLFEVIVPFAAGGIVLLLLGFASGLITTTSSARSDVAMARIDERATICHEAAMASLAEATEPVDFTGMEGRQRRNALASDFVIASGDDRTDRLVLEECSKRLDA